MSNDILEIPLEDFQPQGIIDGFNILQYLDKGIKIVIEIKEVTWQMYTVRITTNDGEPIVYTDIHEQNQEDAIRVAYQRLLSERAEQEPVQMKMPGFVISENDEIIVGDGTDDASSLINEDIEVTERSIDGVWEDKNESEDIETDVFRIIASEGIETDVFRTIATQRWDKKRSIANICNDLKIDTKTFNEVVESVQYADFVEDVVMHSLMEEKAKQTLIKEMCWKARQIAKNNNEDVDARNAAAKDTLIDNFAKRTLVLRSGAVDIVNKILHLTNPQGKLYLNYLKQEKA